MTYEKLKLASDRGLSGDNWTESEDDWLLAEIRKKRQPKTITAGFLLTNFARRSRCEILGRITLLTVTLPRVSKYALGKAFSVSPSRLTHLIKHGMPRSSDGTFDRDTVRRWLDQKNSMRILKTYLHDANTKALQMWLGEKKYSEFQATVARSIHARKPVILNGKRYESIRDASRAEFVTGAAISNALAKGKSTVAGMAVRISAS